MKKIFLKIKLVYFHITNKKCFEVYYTDKQNNEGKIKIYVNHIDQVDEYFTKKYPHLELYDIGEC